MPELTADLIADLPIPQDLQISPDGARVVYALVPSSRKEEPNLLRPCRKDTCVDPAWEGGTTGAVKPGHGVSSRPEGTGRPHGVGHLST